MIVIMLCCSILAKSLVFPLLPPILLSHCYFLLSPYVRVNNTSQILSQYHFPFRLLFYEYQTPINCRTMSSIRTSRKLLKNPNDLAEAVQHLRPRGSYDPLPPPGGYPLPAYIRRKFSFAPELPNVSLISLLPDFASSSLDLGIDLDESESKRITHETPTSIYVRYSLLSLREAASKQQLAATPKPSLPKIDTEVPTTIAGRKRHKPDNPVYVMVPDGPESQPSRSLRRKQGLASFHGTTTPSSKSNRCSASPAPTFRSDHSTPITLETSIDFSDEDFTNANTLVPDGPDVASLHPKFDKMEIRLIKRMARQVPNLFGSFFVVDFQLPGKPIRTTTRDLLPVDLAQDEALFLDDDANMEIPYKIRQSFNGKETVWTLPIEGDLVDPRATSASPSHRFFGQIDLTDFLNSMLEDDADVWLEIAYEEMEKAGIERRKPRGQPSTNPKALPAKAERVQDIIKALHRDYFVIGVSDTQKPGFGITMVSPTLAKSMEMHDPDFLDWAGLENHLSKPQRFITWSNWHTPGRKDKLYCVPMFGPRLACWLCFLTDNTLPEIWAGSEDCKH